MKAPFHTKTLLLDNQILSITVSRVFQSLVVKLYFIFFNPVPSPPGLRKVMVRAHRQAWCWQDEWYGLTIEDIRQLELETQLALAKKMAHYSLNEEEGAETNGSSVSQDPEQGAEAAGSQAETDGGKLGDALESRGELTKQWSTSSRSSNRSSKRGGEDPCEIFACAH